MKPVLVLFVSMMLFGCYSISSFNKGDILQEPPFATAVVKGTPSEAANCVGKYWESKRGREIDERWQIWTYAYQVEVAPPQFNAPHPLLSLVINFEEQEGKTVATAYRHSMVSSKENPVQTVTLQAFEACKAPAFGVPVPILETPKPAVTNEATIKSAPETKTNPIRAKKRYSEIIDLR
jgi:hypothetical protein